MQEVWKKFNLPIGHRLKAKEPSDFTNISLEGDPEPPKKKTPRRLIYCSDGVLEEYSTDEEEDKPIEPKINPKELNWLPWFWYYIVNTAKGTLYVADTCGEKLAWFFGITTPKYQYAIDEYYRLKEEEEREKAKEKRDQEMFEEKKLSQVRVDMPHKLDKNEDKTKESEEQSTVTKY